MPKVLPGPLDWAVSHDLAAVLNAHSLDDLLERITAFRAEHGNVYVNIETETCWIGTPKKVQS